VNCRSCRRPILWARTPAGRRIPIDPIPVAEGNIVLVDTHPATGHDRYQARILTAGEQPPPGTLRYVSHFATCPDASTHRRGSR
jgi:hypothetical protein